MSTESPASWLGYDEAKSSCRDAKGRYHMKGMCGGNRGNGRSTFFSRSAKSKKRLVATCSDLVKKRQKNLTSMWSAYKDKQPGVEYSLVGDDEQEGDGLQILMCRENLNKVNLLNYEQSLRLLLTVIDLECKGGRTKKKKKKKIDIDSTLTDFDNRRRLAVCRYLDLIVNGDSAGQRYNKMGASTFVAHLLYGKRESSSYKSRCIRQWADEFCEHGELRTYQQGLYKKCKSIITDEDFQWRCKQYLRLLRDEGRTPANFMAWLNKEVLPHTRCGPPSISLSTAVRWMRYLGFGIVSASKGWFTDGHEREDVVKYRDTKFLPLMEQYGKRMVTYDGEELTPVQPTLQPGEKKVVFITHDESTFYCNEGKKMFWMENGRKKLLPKSSGTSIMISGFVCDCHGFMSCSRTWDSGIYEKRVSYKLFKAGTNREGWFGCADVVKQVKDCAELFRELHPDCDLVIAFDNSMTHHYAHTWFGDQRVYADNNK
eukprot:CAMPEP_0114466844 /NCGR_PEP_ID=MMETSP0104-20121206/9295_1 /TAXON_ID=37642 ORGANISM="Paraphysomonas imperforata, Strain PA2" /NCGR_SAMPLE_ID=MMETSP0104 /ASSEMBLY_ACC=CAM_ASM_000202 /LENGTH=484 /DNA_ID=CAMNT_0001640249 /DNA_START=299 /DNA_END=1753 /DNA_ORIENTATION=-